MNLDMENIKKRARGALKNAFDAVKGKKGRGAQVTAGIALAAVGAGIGFAVTVSLPLGAVFAGAVAFEALCSHRFAKIDAREKAAQNASSSGKKDPMARMCC